MSTSSSVSSPQQLQSHTCKYGLSAKCFTATIIENGGHRFYKSRRLGSNSCVELDSIRKERNNLKKIVEDMGGAEISDLKDMTATSKSLDLEFKDGNKSANLKKVDSLDDTILKLELKVYYLISLPVVSWAFIARFVAAKMM
ncbi:hypothetical protein R3W88_024268 [Solanum pinnatisectum]|uniref:Uncharacterized protein n=1 Tax=Solanum pinnatisectum TaxID=50273 RepID=A0AAV9M2V5_9SOLN|nr:hypothetical protein R3W88_024268 [Solanum pinnatisectum]